MNRTPDDIHDRWYDLIAKDLADDLLPEEKSELENWIQANPENKKLYEEMKKLWSLPEDAVFFDTEKAWEKVQPKPEKPAVQFPFRWAAVAASIAVIVTFAIQFLNQKEPVLVTLQSNDSTSEFMLPDSSKVWLDAKSTITYLSGFDDGRRLQLNGKAYFEVESDPEHPFVVETTNSSVKVLGTGFLVNTSDSLTLVQVDHGKVQVSDKKDPDKKVVLVKGEQARVKKDTLTKSVIENKNFRSFQKHELNFDDQRLVEVLPELENYFQVKIKIESNELLLCRFTGNLKNPKLNETLKIIALTTGAQLIENQGEYTLSGKGCSSNIK